MWGFPGGSTVQNPAAVQETQVQSLGQEDPWRRAWPPTLAWRIPRTEELGRLQSILSQRVEDGQNDLGCTHSHTYFPDAFSSSAFFGLHSCSSQWMFYGTWLILSTMWHFCLCFILPAELLGFMPLHSWDWESLNKTNQPSRLMQLQNSYSPTSDGTSTPHNCFTCSWFLTSVLHSNCTIPALAHCLSADDFTFIAPTSKWKS